MSRWTKAQPLEASIAWYYFVSTGFYAHSLNKYNKYAWPIWVETIFCLCKFGRQNKTLLFKWAFLLEMKFIFPSGLIAIYMFLWNHLLLPFFILLLAYSNFWLLIKFLWTIKTSTFFYWILKYHFKTSFKSFSFVYFYLVIEIQIFLTVSHQILIWFLLLNSFMKIFLFIVSFLEFSFLIFLEFILAESL